ncbi:MMPL family transporter [Paraburkholderia kururiensis]|uniref:MMPL family transporter n=1 Tax=Paraburkholderia kururiensis TaxID=984307 RepID=A0ABZ0WHU0_9BURK|nr:MMPL family transporter [Paraburkholderia kururiensis]WQD76932.1 MMPL family transporter [Paraburkholderia kururiensis]
MAAATSHEASKSQPLPPGEPRQPPPRRGRLPLAVWLWLLFLVACGVAIARAQFTADLSAFLPRSPDARQQVLVEQLREGLVSRLILVGIEGGDAATRAALSRRMAATLRSDPQFAAVNNGEPVNEASDQRFVFEHRYLLSPTVTPERFSADGLHRALGDSLDLLSSSAGLLTKALLPRDPTGETTAFAEQLASGQQPAVQDGVWASRDGQRALLLVQTRAAGSDTDGEARAIAAVRHAFDAATQGTAASPCRLVMTGTGVFSVETRDNIRHDVERLSVASLVLIAALLLVLYRSPLTLALGLLPVLCGVAAGIAAVSVVFHTVHGLTLGFGTTLIGEAVDYSIYLFVQSSRAEPGADSGPHVSREDALRQWTARYWPVVRLGVLTSVCGFASMLFSGFPGLVQLGLYSIAGLATAALVTRYVLPHLRGARHAIRDVSRAGAVLAQVAQAASRLRWLVAVLTVAAVAVLVAHRGQLWSHELAALSPVSPQSQALDASLRADMGAPDVRYLVVIAGASEEAVLEGAEKVGAQLQPLVDAGVIAGYESPARYLPSEATQRARLASLPAADVLAERMRTAVDDQPVHVKPQVFAPFIADVEAARNGGLLTRDDLRGTSMALAVEALLTHDGNTWRAMLALRAPTSQSATHTAGAAPHPRADEPSLDAGRVSAAVARAHVPGALFVDLKSEADRLYVNYVGEDLRLSLAGFAAIVVLLLVALRSPLRVVRTLAPLAAAVLVVSAALALAGVALTILHLIGMLLIVAVGSNYALFFNMQQRSGDDARMAPVTLVSLLVANLSTVAGFGLLAFAHVPLLRAFGLTVGPGAVLALVFSAMLAPAGMLRAAHATHAVPAGEAR